MNGKIVVAAVFAALFLLTGVAGAYNSGDGSVGNPYEISNSADLIALSTDSGNWDKYFIVTENIDLTSGVSPSFTIGNDGITFTGSFDGQGYTISNFVMNKPDVDYVGLFGYLGTGGKITNLGIETGDSGVSGKSSVGVLVGYNLGSITNCYATGTVPVTATGNDAGGLVGYNTGSITNCYATDTVTLTGNDAGGLVGYNTGSITNSYATGTVTLTGDNAGGLVGYNLGSIMNCYATGTVTVTLNGNDAGGLVGYNKDGSLENCYATGTVTAGYYAGGLVGYNFAFITNCYATGSATANEYAGGFAGCNDGGGFITNCYAMGDATVENYAGGLVGCNNGGTLEYCYAMGTITATGSFAGGLVGFNRQGTLTNCYATGNVTAIDNAGGLVGTNSHSISFTNCYATGTATAGSDAGGLVGWNDESSLNNCYRYSDSGNSLGTHISDITKFRDYAFIIGTEENNGLKWPAGIISTDADLSKLWRVFTYKCHDPIFQWQSFETGTLQVQSTPEGATVYLNGVDSGEVTNHAVFTDIPVGEYNVTVAHANFHSLFQDIALSVGETRDVLFTFVRYSGGDGTVARPYWIKTSFDIEQLTVFSDDWSGKYFRVENDITLSLGQPSAPIGNDLITFTGSFDGQEHTIRNFEMNISGDDVGLFGYLGTGGEITNLGIEAGPNGISGNSAVGVLVGRNDGSVTNCYATGTATASHNSAGGLVGFIEDGSLTNCYATGDATAGCFAGGLVGFIEDGSLENCYATGTATATDANSYAGGLVGRNSGFITNSYATGTATADSDAGGLVGRNSGTITNCYRYTDSGTSDGIHISDITKFRDYAFITGTTTDNGLQWSTEIISTDADLSKPWRVFTYKCQYPRFQWESYETGILQIHSTPEDAAISLNGVGTGESTNHTFSEQPAGAYNVTVVLDDYETAINDTVTVTSDATTLVFFDLVNQTDDSLIDPTPYHHVSDGDDKPTSYVASTPTSTPVPTMTSPTPEATATTPPGTPVPKPTILTGTTELPVGPDGEVESRVTLWADDMSGYLTIDAGVVARDASGMPVANISIAAVPVAIIPSSGEIGAIEHPRALSVFNCTPEGATFSPAISLTFTLTEEEWNMYGDRAEVGWFNSTSGEWEIVAGVPDAGERTITIQVSHFSIYALFADDVPEVPVPDMTGVPAGESGSSSLWLWGILIAAGVVAGGIYFMRRRQDK